MKKQRFLLSLLILTTFLGGFYSGVLFTDRQHQDRSKEQEYNETPKTTRNQTANENHNNKNVIEKDRVLIGYVQDFRDPQTIDYSHLTHIISPLLTQHPMDNF
ncbi:hypothetical protein R4Z10_12990 [Niallia sp. XMNu-256]|uniref:hypothetical protein n=1 Tax=Niallia sp. XMNu-256 TaxID=3082444 RepID=UPI0030D0E953